MRKVRAVFKLIAFILVTVISYLLVLIGVIADYLGLRGRRWSTYFLSFWGKWTCRIMGLKIQVHGEAPKPPFFFISNHLSYVDIMMLISKLRCVFVAKSEVMSWPIFGFMTKTVGMLFVNRSKKTDVKRVNDLIRKNISKDQGVLLFPEGTTSAGVEVLPFKASLLAYPAQEPIPVHFASISYQTPEDEVHAHKSVCWWGDSPFLPHFLSLLQLKSIEGTITFCEKPILNTDRKQLATELHEKVSEHFTSVIDADEFVSLYETEITV